MVLFAALVLFSVNGKVGDLETRVNELDRQVQRLASINERITQLETRTARLLRVEGDILRAIKRGIRCGDSC